MWSKAINGIKENQIINPQVLTYYTSHSPLTDPGEYAHQLSALPTDLSELHDAFDGLLIHLFKIQKSHPHLLEGRSHEVFIRHIRRLLSEMLSLDSHPLNIARPVEKRMIIDCRHFATLLCAVFRHRGIPARVRSGFATYLEKTHYQDHWICEYWSTNEARWVMEDADLQRHDVSPSQFITGGRAWQMCRENSSKGDRFGFGPDSRGAWATRENLVHDFAALNGFECVSADHWGLTGKADKDLTSDDIVLLDRAAALSMTDDEFDERRSLYETSEALRVPAVISSHDYVLTDECREVEWQNEP